MPVAIITGATKGIGKAIAEKLLCEGIDIAVCARSEEGLEFVKSKWGEQFPERKVLIHPADVSDINAVKQFAREVQLHFERADILVNNAGLFIPGKVCDEPEGQLEMMIGINLMSAYHLSRAVIPVMSRQGSGHIFNICSIAGLRAYPGGGSYSISKYALLGLSENLRFELMDTGVKVTAISPGAVWTDSWSASGVAEERIMKAEDVADLIWAAYQLSPRANVDHIIMRPKQGDL